MKAKKNFFPKWGKWWCYKLIHFLWLRYQKKIKLIKKLIENLFQKYFQKMPIVLYEVQSFCSTIFYLLLVE